MLAQLIDLLCKIQFLNTYHAACLQKTKPFVTLGNGLFLLSILGGFLASVFTIYELVTFFMHIRGRKVREQLTSLGYSMQSESGKMTFVKWRWQNGPRTLVLWRVNHKKTTDVIESEMEALGHIFGCHFTSLRKVRVSGGVEFHLVAEGLPEFIGIEKCPKLAPWSVWLGQREDTGENLIISLSRSPTFFITGTQGSGKTLAIRALVRTAAESVAGDFKLVLADTKIADLIDLVDSYGGVYFNPLEDGGLLKLVEKLEQIQTDYYAFQQFLTQKRIAVESYENLRRLPQIKDKIPARYLIILDEALQYLPAQASDSSSKEQRLVRERLRELVNKIGQVQRNSANVLIVGSQSARQEDLAGLSVINFQTRLSGKINAAQSEVIFGEKEIGQRVDLTRGKFAVISPNVEPTAIRLPFIPAAGKTDHELIELIKEREEVANGSTKKN